MLYPFFILGAALSLLIVTCCFGVLQAAMLFLPVALGCTAALLILHILTLFILSLFVDMAKEQKTNNRFYRFITNYSAGIVLKLCRIKIKLEGAEQIPQGRWLLVSNHRSNFDPLIAMWALRKHDIAFVTKPENLKIPIAGKLAHKCCFLPIDRKNNRNAAKTILQAADIINRDVASVGIYPEGTRNRTPGLLPFRSGALKIAQKAAVPIVVTMLHNTDNVVKNIPWRSTQVTLKVCTVIDFKTVSEQKTQELSQTASDIIDAAWQRLERCQKNEADSADRPERV